MHAYDEFDRALVASRVAEFRDQVARRLSGALTEDQFKPLRLMNGIYLQLHAYMLRVAIPYGTLSSKQLRKLGEVARVFDRGYGHLTTRQNIQYNWIKLEEAPDLLASLAEADIHAFQTSGNCIRNVTTDAYAGVAPDEIEDPRIWSEIIRQWSTLHPEFSFLPRKFKIAVSGATEDRAALAVHDIGVKVVRLADGAIGFDILVGGGLGRTPILAKTIKRGLGENDLLSYLEAALRVYNQYGRRDNIYKARIKILVNALGAEKFAAEVEEEWLKIRDGALKLTDADIAYIRSRFVAPVYDAAAASDPAPVDADPAFAPWLATNVTDHRQPGYAAVAIVVKRPGYPPGDLTATEMEAVADLADQYSLGEIRITHEQNLVLPHVRRRDLPALRAALAAHDLARPLLGSGADVIACPGLDYCTLANARSIPLGQTISDRFANDPAFAAQVGPLHVKISGCINSCGHHHLGDIGLLGVDKGGVETHQITIGGREGNESALGEVVGRAIVTEEVPAAVERLVGAYLSHRQEGETFAAAVRRLGLAPFKEAFDAAR